jgi:hypothetical protein
MVWHGGFELQFTPMKSGPRQRRHLPRQPVPIGHQTTLLRRKALLHLQVTRAGAYSPVRRG